MARRGCVVQYILVPYMLVVLPIISSSMSACPQRCTCDTQRHLVDCKNARLTLVPWNLPDPIELTHLDLSGNDIVEINAKFVYTNLKYLDLSDNKIIHITDGVLRDLRQLKDLVLKNNRISEISEFVFSEMSQLRQLDLSSNELTSLAAPIFKDLSKLEDLNLAGNQLKNLTANSFQGLESLHYLNLEDNQISAIDERGLFNQLRSVKVLSLGYNRLRTLPAEVFSELNSLRELDLEDNLIIDIHERAFSKIKPNPVPQLEKLNLRNNKLVTVPTQTFTYLSNVELLDLSQNPIKELPDGAFHGLTHLRKVQITAMPVLEIVLDYAFSELSYLQEVHMFSNHKLKTIVEGAFLGAPELRKIDLHANALRTLSVNLLDWGSLELLDLRYNQWHCDCKLAWLPQVLHERFANETTYLTEEIRCFSPVSLARRLIIDLHGDLVRPDCDVGREVVTPSVKPDKFQDHIMIAIMCSVGGILVVIIVILMCKYGSSYRTAYAPAMDHYVYRNPNKRLNSDDPENATVPVIECRKVQGLRSSLSSVSEIGDRKERRLYRVRFAEADQK